VNPVVLPLPGNEKLAESLVRRTSWRIGTLETRTFPDGESYLRLATDVAGKSVALICTLDHPDSKVLPLIFEADPARELGATRVGLVAPYLAYMRQDGRFRDGEAVTSRIFARLMSDRIDWMVTLDPHLHRYHSLADLYPFPTRVVHAAPAIASWISANVDRPLLVGPDEESAQWVADVAQRVAAPYVVLNKVRRGDREVEVSVPHVQRYMDRTPVILDDIVSSARTMIQTVRRLSGTGLPLPVCIGVHAIFAGDSERVLREAGVAGIATTNCVDHSTNAIDIADLLVPPLTELAR
jgi:ribose-phosphate pyrophosphokinase